MNLFADSVGIFQSDIFLRTSLQVALENVRTNDALLREIFGGLLFDPLTQEMYGQKEVDAAIDWIKNNEIAIINDASFVSNPVLPCVIVKCLASDESANTLNDNAFSPIEFRDDPQFEVPSTSVDKVSIDDKEIEVPPDWLENYGASEEMVVITKDNKIFEVSDVILPETIVLKSCEPADFSSIRIEWKDGNAVARMGNALFREAYQITMMTSGETFHAVYLKSLVEYLLLAIRDSVLAPRGMDCSSVRSGSIEADRTMQGNNITFSSNLSLEVIVHKTWIKSLQRRPRMARLINLET